MIAGLAKESEDIANSQRAHIADKAFLNRKVIAIIVASPLTENIYDRIGAKALSEFFEVVIIDCLDWVRQYNARPVYKEVVAKGIYKASSQDHFQEIFNLASPNFVLDFIGRGKFTRQIQDVCKEFDALYITQLLTPSPNPVSEGALLQSFILHPVVTSKKAIRYILRLFIEKRPLPPDVALLAGLSSNSTWTRTAKKIIFTATPDYFDLQRVIRNPSVKKFEAPSSPYILFIDDCLALSFDFVIGGYKPIFDADEYFSMLRVTFDRLERHFKMPIIIAAHPNGKEFEGYKELFGQRSVLFDATGELSLHCHFATTHYSSAISYPVILRKKIILLSSKKIECLPQGKVIKYIAQQLQCSQIQMDHFNDSELVSCDFTPIVESGYELYEKNYVTNVKVSSSNSFEALAEYLSL